MRLLLEFDGGNVPNSRQQQNGNEGDNEFNAGETARAPTAYQA